MSLSRLRSRDLLGRRRKAGDKGFTLVELLVVITILGILAAVVIAAVSGIGDKGEESAKKTDLSIQQTAQEASCAKDGVYKDSLLLQRDGLQSSQSEYNDMAVDYSANTENCDGMAFDVFTPRESYINGAPETIIGCQGRTSTFSKKPTKAYVLTPEMHEVFYLLGIDGDATIGRPAQSYVWPADLRSTIKANLEKTHSRVIDAYLGWATNDILDTAFKPATGALPARHITTETSLIARDLDVVLGSGVNQFTTDALNPTFNSFTSDYTEADLIQHYNAAHPGANLQTYNGFAVGGCSSKLDKKADGVGAARGSLEGTFRDIQNIGIIFDVQEKAAELIGTIKASMANSIAKAGPGRGMKIAQGDVFRFQFGAPGDNLRAYGGNHGFNGIASMLGAENVFNDRFPAGGTEMVDPTTFLNEAPDILTIVTVFGPAGGAPGAANCTDAKKALRNSAVFNTLPAVLFDRMVCANHDEGFLQSPATYQFIDRIATVMAAGPGGKGPCAATAGTPATLPTTGADGSTCK